MIGSIDFIFGQKIYLLFSKSHLKDRFKNRAHFIFSIIQDFQWLCLCIHFDNYSDNIFGFGADFLFQFAKIIKMLNRYYG